MKAVVFTLGCKVNEVESASLMSSLERLGWETSDKLEPADIYVLNTCAVTREAEKKSRQLLARARKFNPSAAVFVCGCASQKDGQTFLSRGADGVFGAKNKGEVIAAITARYGGDYCGAPDFPKQVKTRAFIKISDGCNNFCSYCIIPYLRGRVENRPVAEIVREAELCEAEEVVLTGINISAYDCGAGLRGLIDALQGVKKRIRLGSLECNVVDDGLLSALSSLYDFAPQFHLSLQSGSDAVLKAMNRKYTRAAFIEKCALINAYFPDAAITTDIIAGFPAETDGDFADSLSVISEAGLARVHAFAFSPREGTAAYRMRDLPAEVKSARLHALLAEGEKAAERYVSRFLGRELEVLWEQSDGKYTVGYTGNYIKVYGCGERSGMRKVRLTERFADGVMGE